jgi:hypothetical protein
MEPHIKKALPGNKSKPTQTKKMLVGAALWLRCSGGLRGRGVLPLLKQRKGAGLSKKISGGARAQGESRVRVDVAWRDVRWVGHTQRTAM